MGVTLAFPLANLHRWWRDGEGEVLGGACYMAYLGKCSDIGGEGWGGWVELREKIWAKYKKCGPGDFNGAAVDVALAGHAHHWVLSSRDRVLTGAWGLGKQNNCAVQLEGT